LLRDGPYGNTRARARSASVAPVTQVGKGKGKARARVQPPIVEEVSPADVGNETLEVEAVHNLLAAISVVPALPSPDDARTLRRLVGALADEQAGSDFDSDDPEGELLREVERRQSSVVHSLQKAETTSEEAFPASGTRARALRDSINEREVFPPHGTQARRLVVAQKVHNTRGG
jgi:hypothetical protein